jgi:heptosyltransferase II
VNQSLHKILIIQTAFIGDVILATAVAEKLHEYYPKAQISFLARKGNESLLSNHPFIHTVLVWNKKEGKLKNLLRLIMRVRKEHYSLIINLHRFVSSGLIAAFGNAQQTIGFDKNPLSFLFSKRIKHIIGNGTHETERNQLLIEQLTDANAAMPKLYPTSKDEEKVLALKNTKYVCIAPSSVWFTKQFPKEKWIELIKNLPASYSIYLLGAANDTEVCNQIIEKISDKKIINLCGKLSFLESASLMKNAVMNFVNDSAPLHIASAVNAPVTAIFCSTIPAFGFGPLSNNQHILQTSENLDCRPCGLHGFNHCPKSHFKCAFGIDTTNLLRE